MNNIQIENLSFNSGDHIVLPISATDSDNSKLDFNLRRVVFTMKYDIDDPDSAAALKKVYNISDENPVYTHEIILTTTDTKSLYGKFEYDLKISFINNPTEVQFTALRGVIDIKKSVTEIMG